jgi:hypothetical protein
MTTHSKEIQRQRLKKSTSFTSLCFSTSILFLETWQQQPFRLVDGLASSSSSLCTRQLLDWITNVRECLTIGDKWSEELLVRLQLCPRTSFLVVFYWVILFEMPLPSKISHVVSRISKGAATANWGEEYQGFGLSNAAYLSVRILLTRVGTLNARMMLWSSDRIQKKFYFHS